MKDSCLLCAHSTQPSRLGTLLYDDALSAVVLHDDWAIRGHAMVIWKEHVENIADLTPDALAHFAAVWQRAERALLATTRTGRAVIMKLGIATPHLHVHIYPVSASLDRAAVMEIIDARVRDAMSEHEREAFVEEIRERMA